jgi:hypothetical protein
MPPRSYRYPKQNSAIDCRNGDRFFRFEIRDRAAVKEASFGPNTKTPEWESHVRLFWQSDIQLVVLSDEERVVSRNNCWVKGVRLKVEQNQLVAVFE